MMKKLLLVVGLAVCMVGVAKAELFSNPGFEDDLNGWTNWGSGNAGSNFVNIIEDGTAHSGDKYVEHGWDITGQATSGFNLIFQNPLVVPGDTYTLSAWVRDGWADPANPGAGTVPARLTFEQRWWTGSGGRGDEVGEPRINIDFDIPSDGQWHFITTTHTAPATVNQFTAIVAVTDSGIALDVDDVSLMPNNAHEPQPADGSIVDIILDTLVWENPAPNDPDYPITCDVYFTSDYPEAGKYEDDPNFTNYAQLIQVNEDNISATIPDALEIGQSYYWRVDCSDPNTGETVVGHVWRFVTDNGPPVVDAGDDVFTWLVDGSAVANLDATVMDDGFPDPPGAYTVSWAVTGGDAGSIEIADAAVEDAQVTITAAGTYELEITANDSALSASDTVTVNVYENGCEAAKAAGVPLLVGDLNEDCTVDMGDLRLLAEDWLMCIGFGCL